MKRKRNFLVTISVALFALTMLISTAFAVPQTINYQGYIENSGGTPVNGTLSMTFSIYNASTGGSALWTETQSTVNVTDGAFSVSLGSDTPINLPFDEQYYLGVKVESDAEMAPRAVLVSVPYAMRAKEADTAGYAATAGAADTAGYAATAGAADTADTASYATTAGTANTAAILGNKTLSELVALLDSRYGNLGDSLVADFYATPTVVVVDSAVNFTDNSQGIPISWSWDFGDTDTSTLQNPSHTYASKGTYTVSLAVQDNYVSDTETKVGYINVYSPVDSAGAVGGYTSIANGADGLPVISYYDYTNGDLKVVHCGEASCSSGNTITTVDASAGNVGQYTSIAIGADNLPVVSYGDFTNNNLKVAHCGDASCSTGNTITTVYSLGTGYFELFSSIAIGADELPVISYYDYTNGDLKVVHCGDDSCTSGNTITTVDSAGSVGSHTSIAVGADDLPVISYRDATNQNLKVAHCGDAACSSGNTITTVDSAGDVGYYTSIAVGADDLPVISYYYYTNGNLKLVHCGDASCTSGNNITTVDFAGDVGRHTSIAIGADNLPIISSYDYTNKDLKVAHCGNALCSSGNTITAVDSTVHDTGEWTSIAIGADGLPVISYYEGTNFDLKVLHCEDVACTSW